jgi:methylglutaconyl-CoA hydratase
MTLSGMVPPDRVFRFPDCFCVSFFLFSDILESIQTMAEIKYSSIRTSVVEEKIFSITLRKAALDENSVNELAHAFTAAVKDSEIRSIVLAAEGEYFCAGMDPAYLRTAADSDFEKNLEHSRQLVQLFSLIHSMRKPVIAAIQGKTLSEGVGLAAVCDYVVGSESAEFSFPDLARGAMPALVLPFLIRRIGVAACRRMFLEGRSVKAAEGKQIGLLDSIVPAEKMYEKVLEITRLISIKNSANAIGFMKEFLAKGEGMSHADVLDYAVHLNAVVQMTDDFKKGN